MSGESHSDYSGSQIKRIPPYSEEAEIACIGTMLKSSMAVNIVFEKLTAEDFFIRRHQLIYQAVQALQDRGAPIDLISVSDYLQSQGQLESIGGTAALSQMLDALPGTANVEYYARIVVEKSLLRGLIQASSSIIDEVYNNQNEVGHISEFAERAIFDITNRKLRTSYVELGKVVKDALHGIKLISENKSAYTGLPMGFKDLDDHTSGLQKGDLIVLAARPSMGKTALALNIAANIAKMDSNNGVMIFSLEMSNQELAMRMLASEGDLPMKKVKDGRLSDTNGEWDKLIDAAGKLAGYKIIVDDTPAISIHELRAKSRRVVSKYGVNLIIVDHLQLVTADDSSKPSFNRNAEISYISRSLKALAKELDLPVLVLSQLSRAVESRTDKHPILSDLRESGAIEQDADIVAFLYREERYDKNTSKKGVAELDIKKFRNGALGTIELYFKSESVRFETLDKNHSASPAEEVYEDSGF